MNTDSSASPPPIDEAKKRRNALILRVGYGVAAIALLFKFVSYFNPFGLLPSCDSSGAKNGLSDIFKSAKLEFSRYIEIKTLTTSKEENTCWAALEESAGGTAEFEYRVFFVDKEPKVQVTSEEHKPAAGSGAEGQADASADQGQPAGAPSVDQGQPAASPDAKGAASTNESDTKDCVQAANVERRIAACTRMAALSGQTADVRANALVNRSEAYYAKGDYDHAIADSSEAIRLDPKYAAAYGDRGNAYYGKNDFDHAIVDYDAAIRLDPKDVGAFTNRGQTYYAKGDFTRAIASLSAALELDPKAARARSLRGCGYVKTGLLAKAEADFKQAAANSQTAGFSPSELCQADIEALRAKSSKPAKPAKPTKR
jgi:tetratricopeptide (TPR) repeat protein